MTERVTAQQAMEAAKVAQAQVAAHETLCAERYKAINDTLKRVEALQLDQDAKRSRDTAGIYMRLWVFAGAIGGGMFAIIMKLLA